MTYLWTEQVWHRSQSIQVQVMSEEMPITHSKSSLLLWICVIGSASGHYYIYSFVLEEDRWVIATHPTDEDQRSHFRIRTEQVSYSAGDMMWWWHSNDSNSINTDDRILAPPCELWRVRITRYGWWMESKDLNSRCLSNQYLPYRCPIKRKAPVIVCSKGQRDMANGSIWGANKYQGTQGDLSDEIHASSSLLGNMMSWLEFYWLCIRECLWNSTRDWQTTKFYDPWPSILFSLPASETDTSSFLTIYSWWTSLLPLSLITLPPFLF